MPNQFNKVKLFIEEDIGFDMKELSKLLTISLADIYKEKIPENKRLINLIIKSLDDKANGGDIL